jgi:type II secretory pathway pseudopilin PulG
MHDIHPHEAQVRSRACRSSAKVFRDRRFGRTAALRGSRYRNEAGISLIEAVLAMVLFLIVATALATTLTSSISSHGLAREKTIAEQTAMEKIESIRRLPYDQVGIQSGNPPGTVLAVETIDVNGLKATLRVQISYVNNDPTPLSYATGANYKRVTVTVTRDRDSKELAREVTYVAPTARAPFGGINFGIINTQVVDFALNTPMPDIAVTLGTGPSATRTDTTDTTGTVTFAALTPNPISGPQAYYDLTIGVPSGYEILPEDVPPGASAHVQLGPGQTFNTALRIYQPATIVVDVDRNDGSPYTGGASVAVTSVRGSQTFSYAGSPLTVTSINGEPVVPGLEYTVSATSTGGSTTPDVTQYVPSDYPNDLTSSFTLTMPSVGGLLATVTWGGAPAPGATVTVTGGPDSVSLSATTDSSGVATFGNLTPGAGYTVSATKSGESTFAEATVVEDQTTTIALALPTGSLTATVTWAGAPVSGATVTLSGGPNGTSVSGTTGAGGVVTFINVPAGAGFTILATKSGQSASVGASVTAGSTTSVPVGLPTANLTVRVRRSNGNNVPGASVRLSGGPMAISVGPGTTDGSGLVTFTNVPVGSGYTIKAWHCTISGSSSTNKSRTLTNQTVPSGGTTITAQFNSTTCPPP